MLTKAWCHWNLSSIWCQHILPQFFFFFKCLSGGFSEGGRTVRTSKLTIHLEFSFWNYPFHLSLFYYLRLSCIAIKGNISESLSKQKSPFSSVDRKHFKTEGKEYFFFFFFLGELSNVFQFGRKPNIKILKSFAKPNSHCLQLLCCYSELHSHNQHGLSN